MVHSGRRFTSDLPYVAQLQVGATYQQLPLLHSSRLCGQTPEDVEEILALYGIHQDDPYIISLRNTRYNHESLEYELKDMVESRGFAAQIDLMSQCPHSVAAFYRAWQKLCRTTKEAVWPLGIDGAEGTLKIRLQPIPYHILIQLVDKGYWRHEQLVAAGIKATWIAPDGEEHYFNPYDYLTSNGSRRRKAFDELATMRGFATAWQRNCSRLWREHPLDELLDKANELTYMLPRVTTASAPKELTEALAALETPHKHVSGSFEIYYTESRVDETAPGGVRLHWEALVHSGLCHDDVAALARVANLSRLSNWLILDSSKVVVAMSKRCLEQWCADQVAGDGMPRRCEQLNRFLSALPTRTFSFPEIITGGGQLEMAFTPLKAVLTTNGVEPMARVVIKHQGRVVCDVETTSHLEVYRQLKLEFATGVTADWSTSYCRPMMQLQELLKELDSVPELFRAHLADDQAFSSFCADLHSALSDLLVWTGCASEQAADKHQPGCKKLSTHSGAVLGLLLRRFVPGGRDGMVMYNHYTKVASCECRLLRWLERRATAPHDTVPAYCAPAAAS